MQLFLLGAPCSGKSTLVAPLRSAGVEVIDADDEIVRLHGGTWPDIETKNEVYLPQVLDLASSHPEVVMLNSYLPVERTRQLRDRGFVIALLDVPPTELRRRDAVRLAQEGWTNVEWFDWHQQVIQDHCAADLLDLVLDGRRATDEIVAQVLALLRPT